MHAITLNLKFLFLNRKLEKRRSEILRRLRGASHVIDEDDDDVDEDIEDDLSSRSNGNAFIAEVLSATTSHPRCLRFPVASRYRIEFLRFFQSLMQREDLDALSDADVKIRKALEDLGHRERFSIAGVASTGPIRVFYF